MYFSWESKACGVVDDANGVFNISTIFLHVWFIPFLPERSQLTAYAAGKRITYPIPLSIKSVLVVWLRTLCGFVAVFSLPVAAGLKGDGETTAAVIVGVTSLLACGTLALTFVPWVKYADYERAVRLAVAAHVHACVMARLQEEYEKTPDCCIIHGLPVSSKKVLYACADGDVPEALARQIERRLRRFVRYRRWQLSDIWVVNDAQELDGKDGGTAVATREVGLIMSCPGHRPAGWFDDINAVAAFLGLLHERMKIDFTIGVFDSRTEANQDLFAVDSASPSTGRLMTAVSGIQDNEANGAMRVVSPAMGGDKRNRNGRRRSRRSSTSYVDINSTRRHGSRPRQRRSIVETFLRVFWPR